MRSHPGRIVTLLPSATEIVCGLGLTQRLVGITHECDFPPEVAHLPRVTASNIPSGLASGDIDRMVRHKVESHSSLYSLDAALLDALQPDLIITQALCSVCAVDETEVRRVAARLSSAPQVVNLEPVSLGDVFDCIRQMGDITGVPRPAAQYLDSLRARVERVHLAAAGIPLAQRPRVALLEWIDPPFNAGHWNPELIEMAGGIDCLGNPRAPSRTISHADIQAADPDVLIVALCGFDATRAGQDLEILRNNLRWQDLSCVRRGQVYLLDGNAHFSRSGPRLVDSLEQLSAIILDAALGEARGPTA